MSQYLKFTPHHQRQQDGKTQQQTTSQRSSSLGFQIDSELVWEDWNLQEGLIKTLVLKNIHSKQQMIHVRYTHVYMQKKNHSPL